MTDPLEAMSTFGLSNRPSRAAIQRPGRCVVTGDFQKGGNCAAFLRHFPYRVVNLHPALPGQFPGTNAIAEALAAYKAGKIKHTGCMVHLVPDEAVDSGPIIGTADVPIYPTDTEETLAARMHGAEHTLLVQSLLRLVEGDEEIDEEGGDEMDDDEWDDEEDE